MRVVDTPITELGFAGVGVGAAMVGLRPVIEFMTWNFALLALDQIVNAAAKMRYMSGGQFNVPDRLPRARTAPRCSSRRSTRRRSRAGSRTSRASRSSRRRTPYDAKGLLKSAIRDDNPVVLPRGRDALQPEGRGARRASTSSRSARPTSSARATTSRSSRTARWCTSRSRPPSSSRRKASTPRSSTSARCGRWTRRRSLDVGDKTNRGVVSRKAGSSAASARRSSDYIQRECFDELDAPVMRVHQADVPMPYAKNLERAAKPERPKTIAAVNKSCIASESSTVTDSRPK